MISNWLVMKVMDNLKPQWQCKIIVHKFNMGDVEDPVLWAGEDLLKYEKSEEGQWVMERSTSQLIWHRIPCNYGWQIQIEATLTPEDRVLYLLKFR